jgi:hypothetical protein
MLLNTRLQLNWPSKDLTSALKSLYSVRWMEISSWFGVKLPVAIMMTSMKMTKICLHAMTVDITQSVIRIPVAPDAVHNS